MLILSLSLILLGVIFQVEGHGMMLNPPGRSSVWRCFEGFPVNWDDNQNYCGGLTFMVNNGGCGICGDRIIDDHPQDNENTGKFGRGKVVSQYKSGQTIDVSVTLTTNHKGSFEYSLCKLLNSSTYESREDCFELLTLEDGSTSFEVVLGYNQFENRVRLPEGLVCERCVLRWHYVSGNNWGHCEDGSFAQGCGPQETFRSCADISIQ
ncbi:uncharacterized protein [Onthophagus taurus]|uniref:uncharacterized protein n=1 Tax=Onthophagus taurus TaxID=166361 RepID=UPI0039BE4703